jgi:hypothetical protein
MGALVVANEVISGYTRCKKAKRRFSLRYIRLHRYFSFNTTTEATGAITAEPDALETKVSYCWHSAFHLTPQENLSSFYSITNSPT